MVDETVTIDGTTYVVVEETDETLTCYDSAFHNHHFFKAQVNFERGEMCCFEHDLEESPYPSGECPACEMERQRDAMREHEMTRDPTLEPW